MEHRQTPAGSYAALCEETATCYWDLVSTLSVGTIAALRTATQLLLRVGAPGEPALLRAPAGPAAIPSVATELPLVVSPTESAGARRPVRRAPAARLKATKSARKPVAKAKPPARAKAGKTRRRAS